MVIYTVRNGDSIYSIADSFDTSPALIISDNELSSPGSLVVGESLIIRTPISTATVRNGDTVFSIAAAAGISVSELYRLNPSLGGMSLISPGQILVTQEEPPTLGRITINAYVYPFVDREVLAKTLPFLSYITIFTYGIMRDGSLIPPGENNAEAEIISMAREYGTLPLMQLSTLTESGTFSSELASFLFENASVRSAVVDNIVATVTEKGYAGIDIDFEYVEGRYASDYAAFVSEVRNALYLAGDYIVLVALAPKTSADQPGLLYEGHSYSLLSAAADKALLMTYEWGYTYGPPMAVAPLNQVRRVVDYALTEMPPDKALLGIPNYGYDWTLPYERGVTAAESLSNVEAVRRAARAGVRIMYDETAQSPYYTYYAPDESGQEREHIVWFEDARSIRAKLGLLYDYGLFGASVWNAMRYFPQLWLLVNGLFDIDRPGE